MANGASLDFAEAQTAAQQRRLERLSGAQQNEARIFALRLVRDPVYRAVLLRDWRARKLHPAIEQMIYAYAWGRPPERIELGRIGESDELQHLSKEELAARARALAELILQVPPEPMPEAVATELTDAALCKRIERLTEKQTRPPTVHVLPTLEQIGAVLEAEGLLDEEPGA